MKKIGIFYGSATGTTQNVSMRIAKMLNIADSDVHDVGKTLPSAVGGYDILVLGTSTWGSGELEDDWFDFLDGIEVLDLRGKEIALFGCGDETMSDTFCSAVGILHDRLSGTGAMFIAPYDTIGYDFDESLAKPAEAEAAVTANPEKAETATSRSGVKNMFPTAGRTAETAAGAET